MNLSVGNITITSLEDLKKTFREKHDDYSFVTEIIDLFVDGDLEEYLKTCNSQDANNYLELLSKIDNKNCSDSELFRQIANVFDLSLELVLPDFSQFFEFIGVRWNDNSNAFDNSEVFWIDVKKEEQTIRVGLRIKTSVMESIELSLRFKDIHNAVVQTYLSKPAALNIDENSFACFEFHVKSTELAQFRTIDILYRDKVLHSFRCYPSRISVKVKDAVWFSMDMMRRKYECQIPFLLWFMLMPKNTTNRDGRYSFDDVKMEDILYTSGLNFGSELRERVKLVEQCVNRLRNHTGLNIQLKTKDDRPAKIAEWVGGKFYFDSNDLRTSIYICLSVEDYRNALKEHNDCFIFPSSKIGLMIDNRTITDPNIIVKLMQLWIAMK